MLIDDIEYVMFRHPDPEATRQFLLDYGLIDLERGGDVIYMRAYGDAPFCYVTSKGDAAFVGIGFRAASREALDQLAAKFGSGVAECPRPGGGLYVAGSDPGGRRLEFVFGGRSAQRQSLPATLQLRGTTRRAGSGWARSSVPPMGRHTSNDWAM